MGLALGLSLVNSNPISSAPRPQRFRGAAWKGLCHQLPRPSVDPGVGVESTALSPGILMSELEECLDMWKLRLGRESDMLSATQQLGRVGLSVVSVGPWQLEERIWDLMCVPRHFLCKCLWG